MTLLSQDYWVQLEYTWQYPMTFSSAPGSPLIAELSLATR